MGFLKKMLNTFEEKTRVIIDDASSKLEAKIDAADARVQQSVTETSSKGTISNMKSNAIDTLNALGEVQMETTAQADSNIPFETPVLNEEDLSDLL